MTRFFLIRHATTDAVGKKLSGRMNGVHLNEQGKAEAQHMAERLGGLQVSAIYSSPLERAIETAEPVAKTLRIPIINNDDFLEINFGEWTNCSFKELELNHEFKLFNLFRSCTRIPGGEMMIEAQARIVSGLQKLYVQHPNKTVVVVSHSDLIKSAIAYYAGIHLDMFQRIEISPASISIIELYDEAVRILLVNGTGTISI
jgi:probable phosphomutase (TIGR03848 family)